MKKQELKRYIVLQHAESDCMFVDLSENWWNGVLDAGQLDMLKDFDKLEEANDWGEVEAKIRGNSFERSKSI